MDKFLSFYLNDQIILNYKYCLVFLLDLKTKDSVARFNLINLLLSIKSNNK